MIVRGFAVGTYQPRGPVRFALCGAYARYRELHTPRQRGRQTSTFQTRPHTGEVWYVNGMTSRHLRGNSASDDLYWTPGNGKDRTGKLKNPVSHRVLDDSITLDDACEEYGSVRVIHTHP